MLRKVSSFRVTRARFVWRKIVSRQVEIEQNILTYSIFFVTDRIKKCEVTVDWCPTNYMTGDFFTEPNQGSLFRRLRDIIMDAVRQPDPGKGKNLGR